MALRARLALCLAVAVLVAVGCKKQAPVPSAGGQAAGATTAGVTPLDGTPMVVAAPEGGNMDVVLGELSSELRKYVLVTRNAPQSFEEFVDKAHIHAPPAPAGQKYAIQSGQIVLVKR